MRQSKSCKELLEGAHSRKWTMSHGHEACCSLSVFSGYTPVPLLRSQVLRQGWLQLSYAWKHDVSYIVTVPIDYCCGHFVSKASLHLSFLPRVPGPGGELWTNVWIVPALPRTPHPCTAYSLPHRPVSGVGSQEAKVLRGVTCNREQEGHGGRRFIPVPVPHRAPYNIRRSSTSEIEEVEVPFTSDEQRRR